MTGHMLSPLRLLRVFSRGHGRTSALRRFATATSTSTLPPHVLRSPFPDISLPKGNAVEYIFRNSPLFFDRVALECSVTGLSYTYGQLVDAVARLGGFLLHRLDVSKGDTVAIVSPNCPEFAIAFYGTLCIGAVATTIDANYTANEIARHLEETQPKVVLCCPGLETQLQEALQIYGKPAHLVLTGPGTSGAAINLNEVIIDNDVPFADPAQLTGDEVALLARSHGTGATGAKKPPRTVALTHSALAASVAICRNPHTCALSETTNDGGQDSLVGTLPFSNASGLVPLLSLGLHSGNKVLTMDKMTPEHFVHTVENHKVRNLHLVPPLLDLLNSDEVDSSALRHVEAVLWWGAPDVDLSAVDAFKSKVGRSVFFQEGYGTTEVLVSHQTPLDGEKIGFVGQLLPNTLAKVVDLETGEALPANCPGEICIKSPSMMAGYHKCPDATSEAIDGEGWLHTGEVGFFDHDGYFKIVENTE
ncbi:uncharacterized protein LOC143033720 [Oratosquilla oratoria]|uniref:uncharacterized protein LOC143033720 n=1 Tax=Oratosquilla oratoria TaxID=337810 RepID=UPI003F777FB2